MALPRIERVRKSGPCPNPVRRPVSLPAPAPAAGTSAPIGEATRPEGPVGGRSKSPGLAYDEDPENGKIREFFPCLPFCRLLTSPHLSPKRFRQARNKVSSL